MSSRPSELYIEDDYEASERQFDQIEPGLEYLYPSDKRQVQKVK